ncbi:MAG TPA: hypothetical protein VNY83_08200 [Solirubrobacterales bacterium]|nr:hypothetical protein [Solirubrobacterales bacterium]
MSSKLGEQLSRLVAKHSVAGDGLLERARSTAFLLFGLTAAIGLGLVAFISQLGWPNLLDAPIPGLPVEHMAVHNRAIAATPASQAGGAVLRHRPLPNTASSRSGAGGTVATRLHADGSSHTRLSGSELVLVPAPPPGKGGEHPAGGDPGGAPSNPPPTAPAPPPPPSPPPAATSPPVAVTETGHPGEGHGWGRGSSKSEDSASNAGGHGHVPRAPVVTDEPPGQYPVDPGKNEPSPPPQGDTGPGNGHGHGYGHYGG